MSNKQVYECDFCKKQTSDYAKEPGWIRFRNVIFTKDENNTDEARCYGEQRLDFCSKECLIQYFLTKK